MTPIRDLALVELPPGPWLPCCMLPSSAASAGTDSLFGQCGGLKFTGCCVFQTVLCNFASRLVLCAVAGRFQNMKKTVD